MPQVHVKVVKVEGKEYLCTVYPMVEPLPRDDVWGQRLRSYATHRYTGADENMPTNLTYARTKQDQDN